MFWKRSFVGALDQSLPSFTADHLIICSMTKLPGALSPTLHHSPLPYLALLANAFLWGISWWPFRQLNELGLHSVWATAFIYGFAVLLITLWRPGAWRLIVVYPGVMWIMLCSGLNNVAFNWAVQEGEVVRVILLFYMMPVWATLLASWLLKEAITWRSVLQIGLSLIGAALVLWRPEVGLPLPRSLHDWLGLIGGACFAGVNVLLRKYADVPSEARSLAMFGGACLVAVIFALSLGPSGRIPYPPQPAWPWLVSLSVFALCLLVGNLGLQYGASRLPAQTTAVVMLSEVVFASGSAILFGAETLTPYAVLGGLLIIGSALFGSMSPSPKSSLPNRSIRPAE
jgi:drug/metabolite transporter (DMT)-like permease